MHVLGVPWVQLPGQQNILVQALFTESDYSIRITDLQTIWGEDLDRERIAVRSDEVDCPIDAQCNLEDLLKHLQDSLTADSTQTSIVLRRRGDSLQLSTKEQLGRVFLEWEFKLTALPYSAVASGLTLSLFSMMSFYQQEVTSLLDAIADKDALIKQMKDFMKTNNLVFQPNRRQQAFTKFGKSSWLEQCREKTINNPKTSQQVIDELSLVGRDANFRRDWRAAMSNVEDWQVEFLPDTLERTPSKTTTFIRAEAAPGNVFSMIPTFKKDDTMAQASEFLSPKPMDVQDKRKIHTKWSSPVSSQMQSDFSAGTEGTPRTMRTPSKYTTPIRQQTRTLDLSSSPTPIYKLRDNRQSQTLEEDLDLVQSMPISSPPSRLNQDSDDDTTDESDILLEARSEHSESVRPSQVKSSIGGTPRKPKTQSRSYSQTEVSLQTDEPKPPVVKEIDTEAERREKALKRRSELEKLVSASPRKKIRKF